MWVRSSDGGEASGSGFIVESSGTIVTSLHVVENLVEGAVRLANGDIYDGLTVSNFDERRDLAIVQIAGFDLPTLPLGNSGEVRPGDSVLLVGGPLGLEGSVSSGIVSAVRQDDRGSTIIQTDAAASPGNSGGPMVNSQREAVGVVAFKREGGENLNFVIPINYARGLLASPARSMSLTELKTELGRDLGLFEGNVPDFPTRWRSLQDGWYRNIRLDGDRLYYEVEISATDAAAGAFFFGELQKTGDEYVGKLRGRFSCIHVSVFDGSRSVKWWVEERQIELSIVSESRIEGRIMAYLSDDKMNCRTGSHSKGFRLASFRVDT